MSARVPFAILAATLLASLAACDVEDPTVGPGEPPLDEELTCDEAPIVTWETFGRGFVVTHCQGCHASTSPNRRDAPEHLVFDTSADVARMKQLIVDSAATDAPRMPPNGGTTDEERERLRIWLRCFAD